MIVKVFNSLKRSLFIALYMGYFVLAINLGCVLLVIAKLCCPRKVYIKFARDIQHLYLSQFVYMYERNASLKTFVYGDAIPEAESALVLPNHVNQDWAPLYSLALRKKMLGSVKTVMKNAIKFIPGFGVAMYLMNWLFLKRNWQGDKQYLKGKLEQFNTDGLPLWLWCFPEGTRMCTKKMDAAKVNLLRIVLTASDTICPEICC
jgi:1-acyl-sn-glycerol-3-phosphate acyltransferase